MKPSPIFHWIVRFVFVMSLAACGSSKQPTDIPITPTFNLPIDSLAVTPLSPALGEAATAEVTEAATVSDSGPSCTILQNLNLRSGPGTAYDPPIQVLPANSVVTPLGFSFVGIPNDGAWTYVRYEATQTEGWVSAASEYIDCNVDLTTLPAVIYNPPP